MNQNCFSNVLQALQPYAKKKLNEYRKYGQNSLTKSLFDDEKAPFDLYKHFLSALNFYTDEKFLDTDLKETQLDFTFDMDLTDQIISYIDSVFEKFYQFEIDLLKNPDEFNKRKGFISIIIMHTNFHCGQALRLQAIYGRQMLKN